MYIDSIESLSAGCERWKDGDLEELSTSVMTQGMVRGVGRERIGRHTSSEPEDS